jgi:hypothetical protein
LAQPVLKEHKAIRVFKGKSVRPVHKDRLERLAHKGHKVFRAFKVKSAQLAHKDRKVCKGTSATPAQRVLMARLARALHSSAHSLPARPTTLLT